MVQFAMCIAHAVCVLAYEKILPRHMAWAQFVYHIQVPKKPLTLNPKP